VLVSQVVILFLIFFDITGVSPDASARVVTDGEDDTGSASADDL